MRRPQAGIGHELGQLRHVLDEFDSRSRAGRGAMNAAVSSSQAVRILTEELLDTFSTLVQARRSPTSPGHVAWPRRPITPAGHVAWPRHLITSPGHVG